ncbi:MAG: hypothetical protein WAN14_07520 [Candidatus Acidiferrales bacterium]
MNRKRWVSLGSAATAEISLDQRLHPASSGDKGCLGLSQKYFAQFLEFFGDASVWTVTLVCEREQTAILI